MGAHMDGNDFYGRVGSIEENVDALIGMLKPEPKNEHTVLAMDYLGIMKIQIGWLKALEGDLRIGGAK